MNSKRGEFSPDSEQGMHGQEFLSEGERSEDNLNADFRRVLEGKFGQVSGINFKSELAGIESISVLPPELRPNQTEPDALNIVVFYPGTRGIERSATFTLTKTGELFGKTPRDFPVDRTAIFAEVVRDFERLGLDFWIDVDVDILPPGEWPAIDESPPKEKASSVLDSRRLEFLRKHPAAYFGFKNPQQGGFQSYHGVVFPNFLILEHPETNNAAYFVDFPPITGSVPDSARERRNWLMAQPWIRWLGSKTKRELREHGARALFHSGEWMERMKERITERLNPPPQEMFG
ncbi:MAG: hypothetical protein Q8P82_03180 [bacterium]|nr:hypothetical protein [bacterium]